MRIYSRNDVILLKYPFTDLTNYKIRPAIIISPEYPSTDLIFVLITSKTRFLLPDEFILSDWKYSGLNVISAIKRGLFTIDEKLILQKIGTLSDKDSLHLDNSVSSWVGLKNNI